jgi:flagellar basal-body rod modification protein FlgD
MSITPVNWATIPDASSALTSGTTTSAAVNSSKDLTNKSAFLTLLVAQIKNQNPLNPTDSVQFLTQLTQYSQLEQAMTTNADLQSIQSLLTQQQHRPAGLPPLGSS